MNYFTTIKNLETTISHLFEKDEKFTSYQARPFIPPGEYYGSIMLAIDVKTKKSGKEIVRNIIGKLCFPIEWYRIMFYTFVKFKKEVKFYSEILPILAEFTDTNCKEIKFLDLFPRCLGARLNINNSDNVDDDALLLLENLNINNFKSVDRLIGFNLEEAKVILRDLATFHAVPLALRLKNPEIFDKKLMPHLLEKINTVQETVDEFPFRFILYLNRHLGYNGNRFDRFKKGMYKCFDFQKNFPEGNEKYVTIVHRNFWVHHTMISFENEVPKNSKILDFQLLTTGSPFTDLVFFLFSSIQQNILENNYEHLIQLYHQTFVKCLRDLNCDVSDYTFENFKKEIDIYGALEASHVLIMFKGIYADREAVKEGVPSDYDLFNDFAITETYKQRLVWTANEFFRRNWF